MKSYLLLFTAAFVFQMANAQLKVKAACGTFDVDILNGTVNNIKPDFPVPEIKDKLPCFTSVDEDASTSKCGAAVFYKDKDISFYSKRDYIEIGEHFKGHLSIPLLGADRKSLFQWLGNPKLKDANWEAFQMAYGTLVLHYSPTGKVKIIQFSTKGMDELSLCE